MRLHLVCRRALRVSDGDGHRQAIQHILLADRLLAGGHQIARGVADHGPDARQQYRVTGRQGLERVRDDRAGLSEFRVAELDFTALVGDGEVQRPACVGELCRHLASGVPVLGGAVKDAVEDDETHGREEQVGVVVPGQRLAGVELQPAPAEVARDHASACLHEIGDHGQLVRRGMGGVEHEDIHAVQAR